MRFIRRKATVALRLATLPLVLATASFMCTQSAQAWTYKILYSFGGGDTKDYGALSLRIDKDTGKLYGTTLGRRGKTGTVFEFATDGTETVLHTFAGGTEGSYPLGRLARDGEGNLYGTDLYSGDPACDCGVVYEVTRKRDFKVLHTFLGDPDDGKSPFAGLTLDPSGNLYGTTEYGGANDKGIVFRLAPDGSFTVLYSFAGGVDGAYPVADVTLDKAGNIFGSTGYGGDPNCDCGTIFKLSPFGQKTILHVFTTKHGGYPRGGLLLDQAGNLYGTGTGPGGRGGTKGALFRLAPNGQFKTLIKFDREFGGEPLGHLVMDEAGAIYGITHRSPDTYYDGIIYQWSPDGTRHQLHVFGGDRDGDVPEGGLVKDKVGNLYGVTFYGGDHERGTIFELVK